MESAAILQVNLINALKSLCTTLIIGARWTLLEELRLTSALFWFTNDNYISWDVKFVAQNLVMLDIQAVLIGIYLFKHSFTWVRCNLCGM